jgi:hypothetical protein
MQARAIEIFWDVENTGCGAAVDVGLLVQRLRALRPTATVVRGLVCGKLSCFSQPFVDSLAEHGLEVALAPSGKNAADRVLTRAMRNLRTDGVAVVLVSGDGGFASALAPFADSILLHTANNVAESLVAVAREHFTLEALLQQSPSQTGAGAGPDAIPSPPWVAVHVGALYRCGRVGAGKLEYPFYSTVSPSAIARAHFEQLGTFIAGRPRAFCLAASHWLREVVASDGVLQLYVPTEALFEYMDSELVLEYARRAGWEPLADWRATPRERRLGNPALTQALLLTSVAASSASSASELERALAIAYDRVGRPHPHPELNAYLYVLATTASHGDDGSDTTRSDSGDEGALDWDVLTQSSPPDLQAIRRESSPPDLQAIRRESSPPDLQAIRRESSPPDLQAIHA